MLRGIIIGSNL